jgi:AcrR family transcriptional regulator
MGIVFCVIGRIIKNERSFINMKLETTSPNKSERTRRMILEAAYNLFLDQGYHATSMRQIAKKSGLALGGIYNHFDSKEDIFSAIIAERHPLITIVPLLASIEGDTVDEFTQNAAQLLIDNLGTQPDFLNLMLIEIVEFKAKHAPRLFEKLFPKIVEIGSRFKGFDDQVRSIPTELLMRAFLGMFFSYYITQVILAGLMPADMQDDALNSFVDIFLNGIKAKPEMQGQESSNRELKPQGQ